MHRQIDASDEQLIQIVDRALQETALKSGVWLACRAGCTPCCTGVFAINQLDVLRLRDGFARLRRNDPNRALRLQARVQASAERLSNGFPGELLSGILDDSLEAEAVFADFANDEVCPVLDPAAGTCDLYASRPMTCRVFGPPVRSEEGIGTCELCFHGATAEEIAACEMTPDPNDLESLLLTRTEAETGVSGRTIVALALRDL